jgi:hypothetical protein
MKCSMSRSASIALSLLALCCVTITVHAQTTSAKKGIAEWGAAGNTISGSNVTWYYDWKATSDVTNPPWGVQFIPMTWGASHVNSTELTAAKNTGAGILLSFNEPDVSGQSNLTPSQFRELQAF